jgi:hypothetical protein
MTQNHRPEIAPTTFIISQHDIIVILLWLKPSHPPQFKQTPRSLKTSKISPIILKKKVSKSRLRPYTQATQQHWTPVESTWSFLKIIHYRYISRTLLSTRRKKIPIGKMYLGSFELWHNTHRQNWTNHIYNITISWYYIGLNGDTQPV